MQGAPPGWSHQITPPRQNLFLLFKRGNQNVESEKQLSQISIRCK